MAAQRARNLAVETLDDGFLDERRARLQVVVDRVAPMALAQEQTLPVNPLLASLLPDGALRRGSVIGVGGSGSVLLALSLAAAASQSGSWIAMVGGTEIGFVAAAEAGIALERVLVIAPQPDTWSSSVAALVGSVDVVLVSPTHQVREPDARRLAARLRERGSVLLHTGNKWPIGADVQLDIVSSKWNGLGNGHGVLRSRQVTVAGTGRGSAARPRSLELLLPGPTGAPVPVEPV